jgi:hypothetical protein
VQVSQFVAQSSYAFGGEFRAGGLPGKKVARMWLKSQHAAGYTALFGFASHQRNHGLVPAMYTIKITHRYRAGRRNARVVKPSKNVH